MGSATSIQEGSGHQPLVDDDYVDDYERHVDDDYVDDDYEEHDDDGYVDDDNDGIEEEDVTIMVTIMGNMVVMRKVIMETRLAMMTLKVNRKEQNIQCNGKHCGQSVCITKRMRG